jgi:hypothetical protein
LKKELGVGCLVEVYMLARGYIMPEYKQLHIINELNEFGDKFVYEDIDCKNIRVVMEGKMVCDKDKIIGKPLTLDRVLLALSKICGKIIISISEEFLGIKKDKLDDYIDLHLTKFTLEEQSKRTQREIYELLGGENEQKDLK